MRILKGLSAFYLNDRLTGAAGLALVSAGVDGVFGSSYPG
jgi:hypothetical protein